MKRFFKSKSKHGFEDVLYLDKKTKHSAQKPLQTKLKNIYKMEPPRISDKVSFLILPCRDDLNEPNSIPKFALESRTHSLRLLLLGSPS